MKIEKISEIEEIQPFNKTTTALIQTNNLPIKTKEEFEEFFPDTKIEINSEEDFLNNIELLKRSDELVEKLRNFDRENEICIAADYDVDGIMACIIMLYGLKNLGFKVHFLVPDRLEEDYGMKEEKIIEDIETHNTKLIITVDNGIGAYNIGELIKKYNVDMIITDHHLPDNEKVPDGYVIIDPKYNNDNFSDICGAYVALKVMYRLYRSLAPSKISLLYSMVPLAGIATIADVMPVIKENRQLIKLTLQIINRIKSNSYGNNMNSPLYKLLYSFNGKFFLTNYGDIATESLISFNVAPNINAVSRVGGDVSTVINNILNIYMNSYGYIPSYSGVNITRQKIGSELFADFKFDERYPHSSVFIFKDEDYEFKIKGILGLISNKILSLYNAVSLVGRYKSDNTIEFSGRSHKNYNLYDGIKRINEAHPEFNLKWGGHAHAMGVSLDGSNNNLELFKEIFEKDVVEHSENNEESIFEWEAQYENEIIETLQYLQPYGNGFDKLKFIYSGVIKNYDMVNKTLEVGDYLFTCFQNLKDINKNIGDSIDVLFTINFNKIEGPTFILLKE